MSVSYAGSSGSCTLPYTQSGTDDTFCTHTHLTLSRYRSTNATFSTHRSATVFLPRRQRHVRSQMRFGIALGIYRQRRHRREQAASQRWRVTFEKPDRVHTLYQDEIPVKMWPLSVHELFMVGRKSASRLEELGIHTIGELAHSDRAFSSDAFQKPRHSHVGVRKRHRSFRCTLGYHKG